MTLLRLSPLALSRSRFALSPLAETLASLRVLGAGYCDPWLASWYDRHHGAFRTALDADPFAKGLVRLLASTKWMPAHIVLPPAGGMRTAIDGELAEVARVPDAQVRAELEKSVAQSWKEHDLDWLTGRGWAARTAELFRRTWTAHVAPDWPRRRALLERDVTYRAGLLAAYGWPRALEHMSRHSAWVGADAIRFSHRGSPDRVVGDEGMLFVPVAAVSRGTWLCEAPPGVVRAGLPGPRSRRGRGTRGTRARSGTADRHRPRGDPPRTGAPRHHQRTRRPPRPVPRHRRRPPGGAAGCRTGHRHPCRPARGLPAHRLRGPPRRRCGRLNAALPRPRGRPGECAEIIVPRTAVRQVGGVGG